MTACDPDLTVIVLAKLPIPGRVKTRLCPPLTPEQAAALATCALLDTLAAAAASAAVRRVLVIERFGRPVPDWVDDSFEVVDQVEGGLDARLAGAFDAVSGHAVLVGMDTPQVRPEHINEAFDALGTSTSVLGLAPDGGFWLIGLRRSDPHVFLGVPMSEDVTGAAQLERLAERGLSTALLGELVDIDTLDDAHEVARDHPNTRTAAYVRGLATVADPSTAHG